MNRRRNLNYRNPLFLIGSRFLKLYLLVGLLLRVVLMCTAPQDAQFSFVEILRLLGVGLATDLGVGLFTPAGYLSRSQRVEIQPLGGMVHRSVAVGQSDLCLWFPFYFR